ncbi:hypothetical protein [Acidicapsa ligni]|uniref:hypothetical protein n=1 Tax=Acidicapsa ligni TaxID=542300 RepID=UPI0021DF8D49|nr:hypothetical protein [Acidicapsa ligni]
MFSFKNSVLLLVLTASATLGLQAQDSSSQPQQPAAAAPTPTQQSMTVQARIRARREQRRATAIHDVYSHLYEVYLGGGYTRTIPGPGAVPGKGLQHLNEYGWNLGVSRYYTEKFGVTLDGRGLYGPAYVGPNAISGSSITEPRISQYEALIGPTYRFVLHPKYSISGRIMGGIAYGNFSSDTATFGPTALGLYGNGPAGAFSASVPFEYNVNPSVGIRIAPEYLLTTFGSSIQNGRGVTAGVVVRFGKL